MSTSFKITPTLERPSITEQVVGELDEARSELFRASNSLTSDYPTFDEMDVALRAISDCQQRIDFAVSLLRAGMKQ